MLKTRMFELDSIAASGGVSTKELRVDDTTAAFIVGFALITDRPDLVAYRGRLGLQLNGVDLFPANYPARIFLPGGTSVAPNERIYSKQGKLSYGDGILTIRYVDKDTLAVPFAAYTLDFLVEYELK